jgi:hypothetical protein
MIKIMLSSTRILMSMAKCLHYIKNGSSIQSMEARFQCILISEALILYLLAYASENPMRPLLLNQPSKLSHELLDITMLLLSIKRNAHRC